jgi:hypothetical protein
MFSPDNGLNFNGPFYGNMPVFGPSGGEIMSGREWIDPDTGEIMVTFMVEDIENPGKLVSESMFLIDAWNLIGNQIG